MTRRDYVRIAAALADTRPMPPFDGGRFLTAAGQAAYDQWAADVRAISAMLGADNPRYDAARFAAACGAVQS